MVKIFDNDVATVWKSKDMQPLIIDLTEKIKIKGIAYVPVEKVNGEGIITKYCLYTSLDGQTWQQEGADREFENIRNNPIVQNVMFEKSQNVRFVKIEPIETADNSGIYTVAEFGIIIK